MMRNPQRTRQSARAWLFGTAAVALVTLGGAFIALRPAIPRAVGVSPTRSAPTVVSPTRPPQSFATFNPVPVITETIGQPLPDEGDHHLTESEQPSYQHYPPASGPHVRVPLKAGYYTTPVPEVSYVHNLEHGYIVVLYNRRLLSRDGVDQLRALLTTFPAGKYGTVKLIVAPYDGSEQRITALAWDRELVLDQVDSDLLRRFYQVYVDHGPEDVP